MSPLTRLILLTSMVRLFFAWAIGLGVDESYMVAAGRVLSLGYFDHPPVSWWLSWAAAHLFGTEAPVVVRLPFILLFVLSTWLTARLGEDIGGKRAGFWAAVLLISHRSLGSRPEPGCCRTDRSMLRFSAPRSA